MEVVSPFGSAKPEIAQEPIVECVPNFSEGRDRDTVVRIVRAMRVCGVSLLDWSMDAAHNRSVVTIAGPPNAVAEAAIRSVGRAAELIDLTRQTGVHPRVGAADVVPFVPVRGYSLGQCAALAHRAGTEIWRRFGVPVYFYEAAAQRPDRLRLEDVRRGQFEGLRQAVRTDATRCPDVGTCEMHPTAGASLLGARDFLIAYNIHLEGGGLAEARSIARILRASGGGLPCVKAMGVLVEGRPQISINLTDFRRTSVSQVYTRVAELAQQHGVRVGAGELIGLIPQSAFQTDEDGSTVPQWARHIPGFTAENSVLEQRIKQPVDWPVLSD